MNNDTNNNLNGMVLGNVDNNLNSTTPVNNYMGNTEVETLDVSPNINNNVNLTSETSQQPIYFNNPVVNEVQNNNVVTNDTPQMQQNVTNEQSQPMPAYTNPQYINPMPGFEISNAIGTTPPISLEPEKKPKKKGNKILFIILVIIALAGVGFGTWYVLKYTDLITKKDKVKVEVKNLQFDLGKALSKNINDYADIEGTAVENCSLDTTKVDFNKEGEYEFNVKCGEIKKSGKITIVDNTELVVLTKTVYKTKDEKLEPQEFIKNVDEKLTYEFVNQEEANNILKGEKGTYKITIKATRANKSKEVEGTIVILEYPIRGHLICSSKEQNVNGISAVMTVSESFAILNDGSNGFGGITTEIYKFKFSDETEYTNYLATYKTSGEISINNVTGDVSFDDQTLTIAIEKERDNESVIQEYGADNMKIYGSIRTYFVDTMKYTCDWNPKG